MDKLTWSKNWPKILLDNGKLSQTKKVNTHRIPQPNGHHIQHNQARDQHPRRSLC